MLAAQALVKRLIAVHVPFASVQVAWLEEWVLEVDTTNDNFGTVEAVHSSVELSLKDGRCECDQARVAVPASNSIPPSATAQSAPYRQSSVLRSVSLAPYKHDNRCQLRVRGLTQVEFISANVASLKLRDATVRTFAGSSLDFGARVRWRPVMGADGLVAAIMNDVAKADKVILLTSPG